MPDARPRLAAIRARIRLHADLHTDDAEWLLALVDDLAERLKPFAEFARAFDAKPIRGLDDRLYGIHTGTEWEGELKLSDCRAARAALARTEA